MKNENPTRFEIAKEATGALCMLVICKTYSLFARVVDRIAK